MYHIKNDKRAQASSELICAGLLACMKEKPFARITITDVQHASTVSRSTFYRNFDCLEDVLALLCDRGFQAVFTAYNALPAAQRGSLAKAVFQYWFRSSAVLEALVQIHRTDILFDSLRRSSGLIEALQPLADDPARFDYFVAIITSAMIGVLTVWVEHGKTETEDSVKVSTRPAQRKRAHKNVPANRPFCKVKAYSLRAKQQIIPAFQGSV